MRIIGIKILFLLILPAMAISGYRDFYEPEDHLDTLLCYGVVRCDQVYESLENVFHYYHTKGCDDSILIAIQHYKQKCEDSYFPTETEILASLLTGKLQNSYDSIILQYTTSFQHRFESWEYWSKRSTDEVENQMWKLYGYIINVADSLCNIFDKSSREYAYSLYLSGKYDEFFKLFENSDALKGTGLRYHYDRLLRQTKFFAGATATIYGSLWFPTGNASKIGLKPTIGLLTQLSFWRVFSVISLGVRGGRIQQDFTVEVNGQKYPAEYGLGGEVGLYAGGEILKFGRQQIDLLFGGGSEGFEIATVKKCDVPARELIHSTFFGPGIGFSINPDKQRFTMITARLFYRFLKYVKDNKIKNDLNGNAIVFQLFIGTSDHERATSRLVNFRKYK
jgi:hypothetical protein